MKIIILILFILNNIYAIKDINKEVIIKNKKNTKAKVNIKNYNLTQKAIINKKHYIKIEKYDPKRIYKLNIRPLISTQIKLLKDEVIAGYILGDKTNFKIEVLKEKATTYAIPTTCHTRGLKTLNGVALRSNRATAKSFQFSAPEPVAYLSVRISRSERWRNMPNVARPQPASLPAADFPCMLGKTPAPNDFAVSNMTPN